MLKRIAIVMFLFALGTGLRASQMDWWTYLGEVNDYCGVGNWYAEQTGAYMDVGCIEGGDVCEVQDFYSACYDFCDNVRCPNDWFFGEEPQCSEGNAQCYCLCYNK